MRLAARTDSIQTDVVGALKAAGCSVQSLAMVGQGVPDLLVWTQHRGLLLFECKRKGGKRTPAQLIWHAEWKGPVYMIYSVDDALLCAGCIG